MSTILTSEVTQLLYRVAPQLNFAQVMGELHHAFDESDHENPVLTWDCDDIALLDFSAARVIIGFSESLPGDHAACLTVAVGQSPLSPATVLAEPDQGVLMETVTERLQRRFPSDDLQTQILDQPLTPDLIDRVVDGLFQPTIETPAPTPVTPTEAAPEPVAIPASIAEPSDMDRLMNRLSSELTARTPSIISRAIASASPKTRAITAQDSTEAASTPAAVSSEPLLAIAAKAKLATGLFWRKAPQVPTKNQASAEVTRSHAKRASSTELKAVREALYATDHARGLGSSLVANSRIAAQTKQALQTLASFPVGIANSIAELRRRENVQVGGRVRD